VSVDFDFHFHICTGWDSRSTQINCHDDLL
jgi:hypothetical protein